MEPSNSSLRIPTYLFSRIEFLRKNADFLENVKLTAKLITRQLVKARMRFKFAHFGALFHQTANNLKESEFSDFSSQETSPEQSSFSLVRASRIGLNRPDALIRNLSQILQSTDFSNRGLKVFFPKYLASALILDAFPADMHAFDPREVFRQIYLSNCAVAYENSNTDRFGPRDSFTSLVQRHFCSFLAAIYKYQPIKRNGIYAHHAFIIKNRRLCMLLNSRSSCAMCLIAESDYVLTCGHGFCESCLVSSGRRTMQRYCWEIQNCIVCGSATTKSQSHQGGILVSVKPPTAGARLLVIDGGGVRGIIPLQFLRILQASSRLKIPIQDYFDLAVGTSSGGLVVLGLLLKGWSIQQCESIFTNMSEKIFKPHSGLANIPGFRVLHSLFGPLISDSHYSSYDFIKLLEGAYGSQQLKAVSYASETGCKVAVTSTRASSSAPCLFLNYSSAKYGAGYEVITSDNMGNSVRVSDAAGSTSAAPWYAH
ncbi:hypothetical protein EYR41_006087 [Orbilia oligospora]|uniref:PNPLA domain-containing protein n=1 Tax=Orbilia oligospora TaxID=2813651 RepID=A0A8H2E018_ORBOL|nr:hypothetical protein EYR41_006087 [Orbilia oligospora]